MFSDTLDLASPQSRSPVFAFDEPAVSSVMPMVRDAHGSAPDACRLQSLCWLFYSCPMLWISQASLLLFFWLGPSSVSPLHVLGCSAWSCYMFVLSLSGADVSSFGLEQMFQVSVRSRHLSFYSERIVVLSNVL